MNEGQCVCGRCTAIRQMAAAALASLNLGAVLRDAEPGPSPPDETQAEEGQSARALQHLGAEVAKVLVELNINVRDIAIGARDQGYSSRQIGEALGKTPSNVRKLFWRWDHQDDQV